MPKCRTLPYKDEPCSDAAFINKMRYYGWDSKLIPKGTCDIKLVRKSGVILDIIK